jgi:hypothetical protein
MRVHEETQEFLRKLPLPLPVVDIELEDYVDAEGDDALRVWVILDEDTEDMSLSGAEVVRLKAAIRECLLRHGITVFPYVFLTKASERAVVDAGE